MSAFTVNVKTSTGGKYALQVDSMEETIGAFKVRLAEASGIPSDMQRLIFRGHVLKDSQTFSDLKERHKLESGQTMHVVRAASTAQPTSATASQSTSSGGANPAQPAAPQPQQSAAFGMGLGGLGGMGGDIGNMADMQRQLLQNPEQMQAMMNSPIMESIMNNPELARSMMMANPQLRELIERNPEVGHIFNDPSTFRQMMQIARNPSLMNEMMRNTDRQMANIEMMPGGFDALRRMHENIQAPLMDAAAGFTNPNPDAANTADTANTANTAGGADNPFASLFQNTQNTPSNQPMPNPWASRNTGVAPHGAVAGTQTNQNAHGAGPWGNSGNAFASLFQTAPSAADSTNAATGGAPQANVPTGGFTNPSAPFPGLPEGMNFEHMVQLLENPMMQNLLSDPQMIETMIASNPQVQGLMQSNPQMAQMLRNPAFLRSILNPEVMRSMMQIRNAMGGAGTQGAFGTNPMPTPVAHNPVNPLAPGGQPQAGNPTGGTATGGTASGGTAPRGTLNPSQADFSNFAALLNRFGQLQGVAQVQPQAPEMSQEQLEDMYSSQLAQLRDMGFLDTNMCVQALRQSQGNVALAVEHLLNRFGG